MHIHVHKSFMNVLRMNACPRVRAVLPLHPHHVSLPTPPLPLCVLVHPSHPSRAVHLYLSQTSIEIDSSDGMISDPSTPDSSSSEEEERSSDDDGGDDSD